MPTVELPLSALVSRMSPGGRAGGDRVQLRATIGTQVEVSNARRRLQEREVTSVEPEADRTDPSCFLDDAVGSVEASPRRHRPPSALDAPP